MVDDRLTALSQIAARGKIHQRIGTVPLCPEKLFDLGSRAAGDRRGTDVRVHLGGDHPTDAHGVEPFRSTLATKRFGIVDLAEPFLHRLVHPMARRTHGGTTVARPLLGLGRFPAAPGEVALVGGNDHPAPGDFITNQLHGHVLSLGDAVHLMGCHATARGLELGE